MSDITQLMRKHLVEVTTYSGVDPSEELARSAGIRPGGRNPAQCQRKSVRRAARGG